ncbi:RNA interference and gene silencing protein [Xylariaceae sp. FL1019]|nr:RNA interference and gene silencing protein [Xylariaceae sp. FL1019]
MSGRPPGTGNRRRQGRGNFTLPLHPGGSGAGREPGEDYTAPGVGRASGQAPGQPPTLVQDVERIENESAIHKKNATASEMKPQRPGYGVNGREVLLWTNYFNLTSQQDLELYRYIFEIRDDKKNIPVGKKAKRVVSLFLEEHFSSERHAIATDFKSTIISRNKLKLQDKDKFDIPYRSEYDDATTANAKQYHITINDTKSLTLSELINYLTSTQAGLMFGSKDHIIQALNIVLNHNPKAEPSIATVGANRHFDTDAVGQNKRRLGAGLEVIRGFFMSVRAATARILVNVQVKNMAFYEAGPLDRIMAQFPSSNMVSLHKFVNKLSVETTHIVRKNSQGQSIPRFKMIRGLARTDDGNKLDHPPRVPYFGASAMDVYFYLDSPSGTATSNSTSGGGKKGKGNNMSRPTPSSAGRYISVYDFFKQTYSITIKDPTLPVVNIGRKDDPAYVPAQVCRVRAGQPAGTRLSSSQTQQMITFAVRRPNDNLQSIEMPCRRLLGFEPTNSTLNAFNLNVLPGLLTVPGRVLVAPGINYFGRRVVHPRDAQWNMKDVKFDATPSLPSWTYLRISRQGKGSPWRDNNTFITKMNQLQSQLRAGGMAVTDYAPGKHITISPTDADSQIQKGVEGLLGQGKELKLILVIVPEGESNLVYNRVKYVCDVSKGILNVCVLDVKFAKANVQYLANVALKFNLKLGGRNHSLDSSKLGLISKGDTMVVGIDVTHPSPGSSSTAPSVAAIVASVDPSLGQWPAAIKVQAARQEMVADLKDLLASRLHLWRQRNRVFPENIIVYRDGVSEGQYDIVLRDELPALREACQELYPATKTKSGSPKITIIIVGKRHNTRFYPKQPGDADRGGNPMNGTVVDRGITEARNWDFFLQSHAAIKGTARPAHYYVIYDQIFSKMQVASGKTPADTLEDLTHNMCYLFGRATKAVSICPPAYYADLACTRARCYLNGLFDPSGLTEADTASVASESAPVPLPSSELWKPHTRIENTMFYI